MKLTDAEARRRLAGHDHAVLSTVHPERGVDAVPVVYAVVDDHVVVPIDLVKPKAAGPLQRERNLAADPRATLLIDHWDPVDWARLWWVRAELRWVAEPDGALVEAAEAALADRYPQYRHRPFARLIVLCVTDATGWSAST